MAGEETKCSVEIDQAYTTGTTTCGTGTPERDEGHACLRLFWHEYPSNSHLVTVKPSPAARGSRVAASRPRARSAASARLTAGAFWAALPPAAPLPPAALPLFLAPELAPAVLLAEAAPPLGRGLSSANPKSRAICGENRGSVSSKAAYLVCLVCLLDVQHCRPSEPCEMK